MILFESFLPEIMSWQHPSSVTLDAWARPGNPRVSNTLSGVDARSKYG
jgi:hypothetical protein